MSMTLEEIKLLTPYQRDTLGKAIISLLEIGGYNVTTTWDDIPIEARDGIILELCSAAERIKK